MFKQKGNTIIAEAIPDADIGNDPLDSFSKADLLARCKFQRDQIIDLTKAPVGADAVLPWMRAQICHDRLVGRILEQMCFALTSPYFLDREQRMLDNAIKSYANARGTEQEEETRAHAAVLTEAHDDLTIFTTNVTGAYEALWGKPYRRPDKRSETAKNAEAARIEVNDAMIERLNKLAAAIDN